MNMTSRVAIPALPPGFLTFWQPFPAEEGPGGERLRAECTAWAQRFNIGGNAEQAMVYGAVAAALVTHVLPHTPSPIKRPLADYLGWGWFANDLAMPTTPNVSLADCVRAMSRFARMTHSPRVWQDDGNPAEAPFQEVLPRLRAALSDAQFHLLMRTLESWLFNMLWETALRDRGTPPGVNEYLAMRYGSGGLDVMVPLVCIAEEVEPYLATFGSPLVVAASEAGFLTAAIDNDRYSYFKEVALGQRKYNLAKALQADDPDLGFEEAWRQAIVMRDQLLALYLRLRDKALATAGPAMHGYFSGVDRSIAGNMPFCITALRYLDAKAANTVRVTADRPAHAVSDRVPPYPTVTQWADLL
ncbi:hypothetical protein [Nocardia sp. NPDC052566]|uniref:terpene synthase family protein n=1 Tax=Nocardia sp. NPDC052566 TaxID=3364330 RepID=UPI0037C5330D